MPDLIERPIYLEQLKNFKEKELIKVVTGIRRCGKSTLFDIYCAYLIENGTEQRQIIRINLEDPDYHDIQTYMQLYQMIKEQLIPDKMNYIFLDEVQNVPEFQKAVDGLDFYRSISEKWKAALAPGGRLYFEVGIGQADAVLRIMRAQGFGDIQVVKDHHDIPRVVFGTLYTEI